ncbi:MAG: DNA repair protein RecO [Patescibacteria group bacterium]|nr:DNA repair protein RecO [Patescibacteria group bacterium]
MATTKTKGIVIKRINLGEADKILTILTNDRGKIRVVAKGVRKAKAKLGSFIELFRYNDFLIAEGRNLDIITGATTIDSFKNISLSLSKLGLAYYIAEVVDRLIEETQDADQVFSVVYSTLKELNKSDLPLDSLKSFFEFNLLAGLGLRPELGRCIVCGKPIDHAKKMAFSSGLGGMLDQEHLFNDSRAHNLNPLEMDLLLRIGSGQIKELYETDNLKAALPIVAKITSEFMDNMIEKNLKSREFLEEVF